MADKYQPIEQTNDTLIYKIRVKGILSQYWSKRFDGMTITSFGDDETVLIGKVIDQAALYSLLRKIRDAGLQLQSLKRIEANEISDNS